MSDTPLRGVGGWLLWLVFSLMLLGPFFGAASLSGDFLSIESQQPALRTAPLWIEYRSLTWKLFIASTALGMIAGLGLMFWRRRATVPVVIAILWLMGPVTALTLGVLLPSAYFNVPVDPSAIGGLGASVLVTSLWTAYMLRSKRVRNTYRPTADPEPGSIERRGSRIAGFLTMIGGVVLMLGFFAFALFTIYVAGAGIRYHWGVWAAFGIVATCLIFRFTLPLSIATFFGARDVLGWHWAGALLLAAPGLLVMAPAMLMAVLGMITAPFRRH